MHDRKLEDPDQPDLPDGYWWGGIRYSMESLQEGLRASKKGQIDKKATLPIEEPESQTGTQAP